EFLRGPSLQHQIDGLAPALALVHGRDAVADIGIAAEPERNARDQTAAADAIEHRIFLGDTDGRRRSGKRGAKLHQRDVVQALVARHLCKDGAEQIWIAHESVRVLMVLVGADAVETKQGRQDQFVHRPIIEILTLLGSPYSHHGASTHAESSPFGKSSGRSRYGMKWKLVTFMGHSSPTTCSAGSRGRRVRIHWLYGDLT